MAILDVGFVGDIFGDAHLAVNIAAQERRGMQSELCCKHVTALGGETALVSKGIYSFPTRFQSLQGCYAPV